MRTYLHYVEHHPEEVVLAAVVEPDDFRRDSVARQFGLSDAVCFRTYEDFFAADVEADAVVVCTPENAHYEPCMAAISKGYHILLEKPIAQTMEQCCEIAEAARRKGVLVSLCHVLRYFPAYLKIKQIIDSGDLGQIISISHTEGVGIDRNTHSYVRGQMNRERESNPMLLAKCCHDIDFLYWITGARCKKVCSFGSLRWFRKENAPEGSAPRCIDCKVEHTCPFSAVDLYWNRHEWIRNFDVPEGKTIDDVIQDELHHGPFGRCVYHCDNDVVDHQCLIMELENEVTISMTMDIFTESDVRTTHIKLTEGEIRCDESHVSVRHFRSRRRDDYDFTELMSRPYHGGADLKIMEDFVHALQGSKDHLPTLIDEAIESHRVCFDAERSRHEGKMIHSS